MKSYRYDFVIVGAGLAGATIAYLLKEHGYKIKVIEKRDVIGGNCYTELKNNIYIHKYGPHIFHTSNKKVWDFVNKFADFNDFINCPIAIASDNKVYNMPFNMNTFSKIFDKKFPNEIKKCIQDEIDKYFINKDINNITNLEEQAISMVGTTIYEKLVKGYTEKQWGKKCKELSPDIIKRLPLRFTYNNNYFNDKYQGIPEEGYTDMIERMLYNIEVQLNTNFEDIRTQINSEAERIIFTGPIDEYFNEYYGKLEYRALQFMTSEIMSDNYQGNAVVNYTGNKPEFTRIVEHKHFTPEREIQNNITYITYEFPSKSGVPCYPLSDKANIELYQKYEKLSDLNRDKVIFAGRMGKYKYYDMDDVIEDCFRIVEDIINNK